MSRSGGPSGQVTVGSGPGVADLNEPSLWRGAGGHAKAGRAGLLRRRVSITQCRGVGLIVFGLQTIGLFIWSGVEYGRYAPQTDFAGVYQAWYLIAHGHLIPHISVWGGENYLTDHAALIMIPLAPLWWIAPSGITLLWLQDLAVVLTELMAFWWITDIAFGLWPTSDQVPSVGAHRRRALRGGSLRPEVLVGLGLLLLVGNPWWYWAVSFDIHTEVFGTCFVVLAAYDLARHRQRCWVWVAFALLCGDVASTYVAGLGLSAMLAGRSWRRQGLAMLAVGVGATGLMTVLGGNGGSALGQYEGNAKAHTSGVGGLGGLLAAPFRSPSKFFGQLWPHRLNLYANLLPAGGIGFFSAWGFGVPLVVLLANNLLPGDTFSITAFQNLPVFAFVSVGTVIVLARIVRWWKAAAIGVSLLLAVSTLGWFSVWFPQTSGTWLRVSPSAAAAISSGLRNATPADEVVAAHGVVGAIAGRPEAVTLHERVPILGRHLFFVTAPSQGIEVDPVTEGIQETAAIASLGAKLVASGGGAWVFEWTPPPHATSVNLARACCAEPAWALRSPAGRQVTRGPAPTWHVSSTDRSGYVVEGDYWDEPIGNYVADVRLSTVGTANVEVWNATTETLLARRTVSHTARNAPVLLPFSFTHWVPPPGSYGGVGPFQDFRLRPASNDDQLEIRVWTSGGGQTNVYTVELRGA